MNDILDLIRERRSAREPYDPNRPFTKHQLDQILEASWAPTAHNMQNFEIVVVDNAKRSSDEACRVTLGWRQSLRRKAMEDDTNAA